MPNQKSHHKAAQKAHLQAQRNQKRASDKRARQKENRAKAVAHQTAADKRRRRARMLTFVVVVIVVLALPLSLLGGNALIDASTDTTLPNSPCPAAKMPKAEERDVPQPPSDVVTPQGQYTATMETSCGNMTFQLSASTATVDVNNFVYLARKGFYDNTIFHRVIKDFVVQGGDPTAAGSSSPGTGDPGYRYTGSTPPPGTTYALGDLAMANSGDPSSNGSQFFIVVGPQGQSLPPNYSLFGKITEGLDVAQKIAQVPTGSSPADVPTAPVVLNKVTISSVDAK